MILTAIYQLQSDQTFDLDYYMKSHIPLVRRLFGPCGMTNVQVLQGTSSPNGPAPTNIIALLDFESEQAIKTALETHGAEVIGDVANFTNAQPSIQFNEVLT